MIKVISIAMIADIAFIGLQQGQVIPDSVTNFLVQLPFVGILIWIWQRSEKTRREDAEIVRRHVDRMLELQRDFFSEVISVERITQKERDAENQAIQRQMIAEISTLVKQTTLNTATVNEMYKVDDVVRQVLDRLEGK